MAGEAVINDRRSRRPPGIAVVGTEPFRSRANSLPGANRPIGLWPILSLANSLPGPFALWNFHFVAVSLRTVKNHYCEKKFIQRNQSNLKHAVESATKTIHSADIGSRVWGTPANFNGYLIFAALLHSTLVVGISQTLRR